MTGLLTDNMPLLAASIGGVDRLRRLILDLAVSGRLVDSRGDDGCARAELEQRGIASSRPHAKPTWAVLSLGQIGAVLGGATPSKSRTDLWDGEIPWVSPKDMKRPEIADAADHVSPAALDASPLKLIPAGSILMVVRGMILAHSFPVAKSTVPVTINQDMKALVPPADYASYLLLILQAMKPKIVRLVDRSSHGTCKLVSDKLWTTEIEMPPLAEQHRIVAKVDELMALCDRLEARQQDAEAAHARLVRALLDSLTQARDADEFQACWRRVAGQLGALFTTGSSLEQLAQAVLSLAVSGRLTDQRASDEPAHLLQIRLESDARSFCGAHKAPRAQLNPVLAEDVPFQPPQGWSWTRLGSLFRVITDGDHQAPPQTSDGIAFLTIGNVTEGFLNFQNCRSVEESYFEGLAAYRKPAIGDLLYTVVGATYGRPVLVDSDRPFCVQRHIAILKRSEHLDANFALYLLQSPLVYQQASASTTGTAQPTIPLKALRNMLVPLPPLAEQRRIVAKVAELLALCDQLKARIAAARAKHVQLAEALVAQAVVA